MEKMVQVAAKMNVSQLKEQILAMMNDFRDEAGDVLNALLAALEMKVPASEFEDFCESI